jgi:nucleotide sugar dehydrogenase
MRIFNTYGPRMRANDGRAIPNFVSQALSGAPITVQGDGSQTRSVTYVDDTVEGALRLLFSDLTGPVNIGNPHEMSILELAQLVRELTGSDSAVQFTARAKDDPSQRRPDITLARTELEWEPNVDVRDGLLATIAWFRDRQESASQIGSPSPVRVGREQPGHKVAVVGTGYVGAVTATCLAFLGHSVCGLDTDTVRAGQLNNGQTPFHEPGLPELLKATLATGRLQFTDKPAKALSDADFVFLCVGTPPSPDGSPDLTQLQSAIQSLAPYLRADAVIINKSTVPVGSGNWTRTILEDALQENRELSFHVVSNPEFLREACAIDDFLYPDRIVLGGAPADVGRVAELYAPVLDQTFDGGRRGRGPSLITTDLASAEMVKYAANAFLATKISFANEMAQMCELFGADVRQVLPAVGADHRVGTAFLNSGIGWGGSCFGKDIAALISTGQEYGYTPAMLQATVEVNKAQLSSAVCKLQRELHILKGRRIALLGLTFKPGTDDLRDAPALELARRLLAAGAVVSAFDPPATPTTPPTEPTPSWSPPNGPSSASSTPPDCTKPCAATSSSTAATAYHKPTSPDPAYASSDSAGDPGGSVSRGHSDDRSNTPHLGPWRCGRSRCEGIGASWERLQVSSDGAQTRASIPLPPTRFRCGNVDGLRCPGCDDARRAQPGARR